MFVKEKPTTPKQVIRVPGQHKRADLVEMDALDLVGELMGCAERIADLEEIVRLRDIEIGHLREHIRVHG